MLEEEKIKEVIILRSELLDKQRREQINKEDKNRHRCMLRQEEDTRIGI